MSVIHRYIQVSFLKYFTLVLVMVVAIYLSIDFISRIDKLVSVSSNTAEIMMFFIYKTPLIIAQITPLGVLLSVLIVFGLMNRNNEIVALKSSGISVFYLLRPVVLLGLVFSIALFVFSEVVVPISISESNRIEEGDASKDRMITSRGKNIWIRHDRGMTNVNYYRPADQALFGVSIYFLDDDFSLVRRIDAESGEYKDGEWVLHDAMIQSLETPDEEISIDQRETITVEMDLVPSDFSKVVGESEEMSFTGLWRYIQRVESEGYDATEYKVDFYGKTAFPFVCLIMSLMGSALALRVKTRDGMAVSFGYGIVTAFLYWSVYSFSLSLGYGGLLPSWLAAWMTNIFFSFVTGLMLLNLE